MKKIVGMILVFVSIMAFSGLTMATPVSAYSYKDVNAKVITNMFDQYTYSWHLIYYNSKHCTFCISKRYNILTDNGYYDEYGNWITNNQWWTMTHTYVTVDFKSVNKNHVSCTTTAYVDGRMVSSSSYTKKTSLTLYKYFKTQKNKILGNVGV